MSSVNKIFLLGRLGQDPDVRPMPDGTAVVNFSVATSSFSKDKREFTEWHKCACFNKAAEVARDYLKKGSQVFIEGSQKTRKWQDKDGRDVYTTEVVVGRLVLVGGKSEKSDKFIEDDDIPGF